MHSDSFDKTAFIMLLQALGDGSVSLVSSLNLFFLEKKYFEPYMHLIFFRVLDRILSSSASPNHLDTCSLSDSRFHPVG